MSRGQTFCIMPVTVFAVTCCSTARGQYAAEAVSYDAGSSPTPGFVNSAAAIGSPEHFSGEGGLYPSVVSPFSPPFLSSEVVSIGEGGQLTLRLSHYALPQAGVPEIGVFTTVGLIDDNYPNGYPGMTAGTFLPIDHAVVEVSENGTLWAKLVVDNAAGLQLSPAAGGNAPPGLAARALPVGAKLDVSRQVQVSSALPNEPRRE